MKQLIKLQKSQTGFSHTLLILIIFLIGTIGFTGWKVYNAKKATEATLESTAKSSSLPAKNETKVPEGFIEYENKELGFKFAYPKEWGNISEEKTDGHKSTKSFYQNQKYDGIKEIVLRFSDHPDMYGSLRSHKYVVTPLKEAGNRIVSYCKVDNYYVPSYSKSILAERFQIDGTDFDNYVATGQEECGTDVKLEDVATISSSAILIPRMCNDRHGCQDDSTNDTILIIKTELTEFPGLKLITGQRTHNDLLKQVALTYQKL